MKAVLVPSAQVGVPPRRACVRGRGSKLYSFEPSAALAREDPSSAMSPSNKVKIAGLAMLAAAVVGGGTASPALANAGQSGASGEAQFILPPAQEARVSAHAGMEGVTAAIQSCQRRPTNACSHVLRRI